MAEIRAAFTSAEVYPSMAVINAPLLSVAAGVMKMSESDTASKLQQKIMLPVRKPAKGMALIVDHQYLKRIFGHRNGSLTSVATAAYVKHIPELKGTGSWSSPSTSSIRRVLKLFDDDESVELLRDDAFLKDAHGRRAMLDALAKVVKEIQRMSWMITWSGRYRSVPVIRFLYGHF